MAQALFDQHPLEEYFRNTGEMSEPMPGGSPDFVQDDFTEDDYSSLQIDTHLPSSLAWAVQIIHRLLQSSSCTPHENSFAERFKYDVISSSLLSSSLAAPASVVRRPSSPELPGELHDGDFQENIVDIKSSEYATAPALRPLGQHLPIAFLSVAVFALSASYYFLALIPLFAAIYTKCVMDDDVDSNHSTIQNLDALNELISAGNVWDSTINEAITLIEKEERSIFYGPTSTQAPSSALRIALRSSLHTTQNQCDNVRQLLSALTSPALLSQIAEMYAPSSPVRPALSLVDSPREPTSPSTTARPFSHPMAAWRQRTTSPPKNSADKRATWNGSYAALALAGSPTAHLLHRRKQNRRSDVISLFQSMPAAPGMLASMSAPVSPQPVSLTANGRLEDVSEEKRYGAEDELESKRYFGAAALDLQRKRKSAGLESFGLPPPSYTPPRSPLRPSSHTQPLAPHSSTISSSSRLTSVHTTRHPLSLSGLHLALQGALAAKRYSCSHLLALRFGEDEDDAYWEDVRSVMALLTSTFSDASTRLVEALDDAEKRRIKDEHPTPPRGNTPAPNDKTERRGQPGSPLRNEFGPVQTMAEMTSFAPMPSHMARFAGHVDAISTALSDARGHIEESVAALRHPASRPASLDGLPSVQDHPAFQAYDRLRKELGYALRECERGRERLLDILHPRPFPEPAEDGEASPHTPGLRHDSGSETSERDPVSPNVQPGEEAGSGLGLTLSSFERAGHDHHDHLRLDDASAHLPLTASAQHLPAQGVEQVFEAEAGSGAAFTRERSKMSREERIRLMKARRVGGLPLLPAAEPDADGGGRSKRERWGPGGEVVQELKDVIWKVGEKRRKMSQQVQSQDCERAGGLAEERHPVPVLEPAAEGDVERTTAVAIEVDVGTRVCAAASADSSSCPTSLFSPLSSLVPACSPPLSVTLVLEPTDAPRTVSHAAVQESGLDPAS